MKIKLSIIWEVFLLTPPPVSPWARTRLCRSSTYMLPCSRSSLQVIPRWSELYKPTRLKLLIPLQEGPSLRRPARSCVSSLQKRRYRTRVTGLFWTLRLTPRRRYPSFSPPLGPQGVLWSGSDPLQGGEISDDLPKQQETPSQLSLLPPIIEAERLLV